MAKNQSTYTLQIDAQLGNLQSTLNEAKKSLSSLMSSDGAPKGLEKTFEKINQLLGSISDKAGGALNLKGLAATGKDLESVQESFRTIIRLLGSFDNLSDDIKLSFLSPEQQKQISDITKSLKEYEQTVVNTSKKLKDLETAQKGLNKDEASLNKAKKNVGALTNKRDQKAAELRGAQGKLSAVQNVEGANPEKIAKYKAEIIELEAVITGLNRDIELANDELKRSQETYDASAEAVSNLEKEISKTNKGSLKELKDQARAAGVSLDGLNGKDAASQMQILNNRLRDFKTAALNSAEPAFNAIVSGCSGAEQAAKDLGDEVLQASKAVTKMDEAAAQRDAFEGKIKQFLGLQGAAQVMRSALRDAMATITELDAVMTEMAVVTDLTVGDYWDQLPEYSARASQLGVSVTEAYKAATLYYQQGLKTNEVNAISTETLKMAKVAGIDAAEATDKMTAALRGFNMELNEASAQKIADVYSELAAITAADVDEISTAMTKTASIASSAGMEFETTAAFLSQIIETTRESAETAGTAMKTVIARFQELKKAPGEIGEIDGEIVDANAIETALKSVGVSLRDTGGQFRELDDVFLELSRKWDGLDKNTQRYIATIAAGSRQQSRFIAMMQDYGRTQELVSAANNSAGASQRQFEKTTESLQYKIEQLKNAWHEFTMGIMDSDLVKFGVDILTKFLETINKATSAFDGLGGSLVKVVGVFSIFKLGQKLFEKFMNPLKKFFVDVVVEARKAGEEAAKAYADGNQQQLEKEKDEQGEAPQKQGAVQSFKSGMQHLGKSRSLKKELKAGRAKYDNDRNSLQMATNKKAELEAKQSAQKDSGEAAEAIAATEAEISSVNAEIEELTNNVKMYEGKQTQAAKEGQKGFKGVADACQQTSAAMMGVGSILSIVGGVFSSLGLEKMGGIISVVGNAIMFVGGALAAIPPILTLISTHPLLIIIVAIVTIVLTVIIAIASHLKKMSAEGRLKAAAEAAERAAQAADEAAESFEKLVTSLDELEGKYEALDELTRGTKEWNRAVQDINSSVLDLIENYPELAKFVENKEGVLTIDVEGAGVQEVINKAEARKIMAQNYAILANVAVEKARGDVEYSELSKKGKINRGRGNGKEDTKELAKALASGEVLDTTKLEKKLQEEYGYSARKAKKMAENLSENSEALRDYGDTLNTIDIQQQAAYDAIAASAQSLADTLSMTEEQIRQSSNLVDGDIAKQYYEEKEDELSGKKMKKLVKDQDVIDAIEAEYGPGATINKKGKVKHHKNGKDEEVTLTEEEIIALVATKYATEQSAQAIESSDEAIRAAGDVIGSSAVNNLYNASEGGALTKGDVDAIFGSLGPGFTEKWRELDAEGKADYKENQALLSPEIQRAWKAIEESGGSKAYGDDITKFIDDLVDGAAFANEAFVEAGEAARDFMTADMASGFAEKLNEVAEKAGGETAKAAVISATDTLLSDKTEEQKAEIQSRINMADWTNIESLLALQIDLEYEYGISTEAAKEYINTLGDAAYATSSLETVVSKYGELWAATEKISQSTTRLTQLQWEYNRALQQSGKNIKELSDKIIAEHSLQFNEYQKGYAASNDNIARIYASAGTDYSVDLRQAIQLGTYGVSTNSRLDEFLASGKVTQKEVDDLLERLNDQYKTSYEQLEGMRESLDSIESYEAEGEEAYFQLKDLVKETLLNSLQEQIDLQRATLEATRSANTALLNKIQEQIDQERQDKQNEEAEENIASLRSQQAYLMMDTSDSSLLKTQELDKQLEQAEQDYQDMLIDQTIQELQSANEKAEQQRERQISIAEQSREIYSNSAEFLQLADEKLDELLAGGTDWENSSIGQLMLEQFTQGMDTESAAKWAEEIGSQVGAADTWKSTNWGEVTSNMEKEIAALVESQGIMVEGLTGEAAEKKTRSQATTLRGAGMTSALNAIGVKFNSEGVASGSGSGGAITSEQEEKMNTMSQIYNKDADYKETEAYKFLTSKGISFQSQTDYYKNNTGGLLNGTASYKQYLVSQYSNAKQSKISTLERIGAQAVPADIEWKKASESGKEFKLGVINYTSGKKDVKSGAKADGATMNKINAAINDSSANGNLHLVYVSGQGLYARKTTGHSDWYKVQGGGASTLNTHAVQYISANPYDRLRYKTGGLADFTGPAWLDGTPSRPEYVLSAAQTERFFSLIDVLESYDADKKKAQNTGDNYFDISINVEKIEDDYDVEQMANKIRSMIYEDATYRNVNAINHIR